MKITLKAIRSDLYSRADAAIAAHSMRFFKAGPGEYGQGDRFLGIRVPVLRKMVKKYRGAALRTIESLQKSNWHEERLLAVLMLVQEYKRGDDTKKLAVYESYLANREFVNNWDLVDSSAHLIVGPQLEFAARQRLYDLASSDVLWDRRIAMMATYHFIKQMDFVDALNIAKCLLADEHDLIHKIVGWMLREIGNRDRKTEEAFLMKHYRKMPRTMLRYAIEKFPETRRKAYLHGTI